MEPYPIAIPRLFHSVQHDGLFQQCYGCERDLLREQIPYAVAKHIVVAEPVFEMAVCLQCVSSLQSQETQQRISAFLASLNLQRDFDPQTYTWEDGLRACLICRKVRELCRRYQILGVCLSRELLVGAPPAPSPYLICDECNAQLSELLSKETKDNWDRFLELHSDDPPGIELDSPRFDPVFV